MQRHGEVAGAAFLAFHERRRKNDLSLLTLGQLKHTAFVVDPVGVVRFPEHHRPVFGNGGKRQVGVDVVRMTGDAQSFGVHVHRLSIAQLGQHAHGELAVLGQGACREVGCQHGMCNATSGNRSGDATFGCDDTIVARLPRDVQLLVGRRQVDVVLQLADVAQRELVHLLADAQRVGIGVQGLDRARQFADAARQQRVVIDAEIVNQGTPQVGIAGIAASAEVVLNQLTQVAGVQADLLRRGDAVQVEAGRLAVLHQDQVVPLALLQRVASRDAALLGVVARADGVAGVLGVQEHIALARRVGKAPDKIAVGGQIGLLWHEHVHRNREVRRQAADERSEAAAKVEVSVVGAQAEHILAGILVQGCALTKRALVFARKVGCCSKVKPHHDAIGLSAQVQAGQ